MFFRADKGFARADRGYIADTLAVGAASLGAVDLSAGQVQIGDGTAGVPAVGFKNDTDTGVYRSGGELKLGHSAGEIVGLAAASIATASGIGMTSTGNFQASSAFRVAAETKKTINYTATATDSIVVMDDGGGAALTLTLPAAPGSNQILWFRNQGTSNLTIARNGKNINGVAANLTIAAGGQGVLVYDGTEWWRIGA